MAEIFRRCVASFSTNSNIFNKWKFRNSFSGIYNFTLNKVWTFDKGKSNNIKKEGIRYLILFVIQIIVSGIITELLSYSINNKGGIIILKILVDVVLFVINFIVQKNWVFKEDKHSET